MTKSVISKIDGVQGSTHSGQLEKWLGTENVQNISDRMRNWYGPPIALQGVPGKVFVTSDGDFIGEIRAGYEMSAKDRFEDVIRRIQRGLRRASRSTQLNAGFASLSELIAALSTNQSYNFNFQKVGATGTVGVTNSLWGVGNMPIAGANAANAPSGESPTSVTPGAFLFTNPINGDTQHFIGANISASVGGNTLLLYDRLFQVNKTMNSTTAEIVTGVPTRYQSTITTDADYIGGNFLFVEVGGTALAATAHNWTTCTYNDQTNTASTLPSLVGNSSAIVRRLDHPAQQWFAPLESGDVGIKALTQMQCNAAVATGVVNFVIGHPIAWIPCPIANYVTQMDGVNTAMNLVRIFNDAALSFLEITKSATTATTYTGTFTTAIG
jgi:hypothetical protein